MQTVSQYTIYIFISSIHVIITFYATIVYIYFNIKFCYSPNLPQT